MAGMPASERRAVTSANRNAWVRSKNAPRVSREERRADGWRRRWDAIVSAPQTPAWVAIFFLCVALLFVILRQYGITPVSFVLAGLETLDYMGVLSPASQ